MSYALGNRIKELRIEKKISQEEVASAIDTTRQRYSRIEKGQIDISFRMIQEIAKVLGISTKDITNVVDEKKGLTALFREKNESKEAIESVRKIEEILKVFNAHEKLYHQMRKDDLDEI